MAEHPYRDPAHKMSPMYFDTGQDRFTVDLSKIKYMWINSTGSWTCRIGDNGLTLCSETGARVYNALRAYHEE